MGRSPTGKNFFLDDQDPFTFSFEKFMSRKPCSRSVDSRSEDTTGMELTEEAGQDHLACSCAKKLNSQRFEIQLCKNPFKIQNAGPVPHGKEGGRMVIGHRIPR